MLKLDLNSRESILEFARQFDMDGKPIVCLAGGDIIRFARALGEALGVHDEGSNRNFDREKRKETI